MKEAFKLPLLLLPLGKHNFHFDINDAFFQATPESLVQIGSLSADIELVKHKRRLEVNYAINGSVELACDRCLLAYNHPIAINQTVIYSAEPLKDLDEDAELESFDPEQEFLDLYPDIYDFITLEIPFKKTPSDCPKPTCPPEMLKYLQTDTPTEIPIDDRLSPLSKLKFDE